MNWDRIESHHYHKEPTEYIYAPQIFDLKDYDRLYENQSDLEHQLWKDFDKDYRIGFELKEDFIDLDFNKQVMCLWFFKERNDKTISSVSLAGKSLKYLPNTFLITTSKDITFVPKSKRYIRNPLLQLDMSLQTYKDIVQKVQK